MKYYDQLTIDLHKSKIHINTHPINLFKSNYAFTPTISISTFHSVGFKYTFTKIKSQI